MLPVHNFSYGLLTPALAYTMSVLGAFLGLRCTARARAYTGAARARWLVLAAVSIGTTGIWVMHFIAMLGFTIPGEVIRYNVPVTILSMLIAVAVVCVGLFIVGFSLRMPATMRYSPGLVALSVVIAIVAATAALWATLRLSGLWSTLGAALIMGVAVSGMHYTGMAAMHVYRAPQGTGMLMGGATAEGFLLPLILGISILSFVLTSMIALSPNDVEIRHEAELMERISKAGIGPRLAARPFSKAGIGPRLAARPCPS